MAPILSREDEVTSPDWKSIHKAKTQIQVSNKPKTAKLKIC